MKECEVMKIKEIVEELKKPGGRIATIAKSIDGISEKRLSDAFKRAGYKHETKGDIGWKYIGEAEEPLEQSIFDFILPSNVKSKTAVSSPNGSPLVDKSERVSSSNVKERRREDSRNSNNNFTLTNEEIAILKEIAQEAMKEKEHQTKRDILHKRIMSFDRGETTRKTVIISKDVGAKLDEFSAKTRFNKSNLLEIAILDLINRYE